MPTVYFTADPHFGHANIIRYENRPFASVEEMDRELIRRWNETVTPEDTVYLLGDFSFYGKEKSAEILAALQGQIRLVMGNHDTRSTRTAASGRYTTARSSLSPSGCSRTSRSTSTAICPMAICSAMCMATRPMPMPVPSPAVSAWSAPITVPSPLKKSNAAWG